MKKTALLFALLVALPQTLYAEAPWLITKNVATRVCGHFWLSTTAKVIGAAVTGIDCEIDGWTDGASADGMIDLTTAEAVVGANGEFCAILTAAEANIDYGVLKCVATNANAADWAINLTSKKVDIRDGGVGPLAAVFDGVTLAEGVSTLDLEAAELTADNQFRGDRVLLYSSAGKYYGSSCITSSTNLNERVTTEEDLSALHTAGDSYALVPDAACYITASKIQADALGASEIAADAIGASEVATDAIGAVELAADAIGAVELASDAIGADELATDAIGAVEIATGAGNRVADHVLRRTNANIEASTYGDTLSRKSLYGSVALGTNKLGNDTINSELDIYKADDITVFYSKAYTTSASAAPITGFE